MTNSLEDFKRLISSSTNATSYNVTENADGKESRNASDSDVIAWLDRLLPPLLFTIGIISNTLVVLVMRSKYFRFTSTSFYMIVNAVTDALCLLLALPTHYVYVNFPSQFKPMRGKNWICSLFNVIGWGTSDLGIYFTVAMTIERAFGVWKPLKMNKFCSKKRAKLIVMSLIFFEIIKLLPLAVKSRVVDIDTNTHLCDIDRSDADFEYFYDTIWSWFHVAILCTCYLLAMGGNCAIVFYVRKSSKTLHLCSGMRFTERGTEARKVAQSKQISIMLVIDSVTLIICTLPFAIVNVLSTKWRIFLHVDGGKNLAFTLSFYLLYINRCLNLFLYCVSGERFRKAMKKSVCIHSCCTAKTPQWRRRIPCTRIRRIESTISENENVSIDFAKSKAVRTSGALSLCSSIANYQYIALSSVSTKQVKTSTVEETRLDASSSDSSEDTGIFTTSSPMFGHGHRNVNGDVPSFRNCFYSPAHLERTRNKKRLQSENCKSSFTDFKNVNFKRTKTIVYSDDDRNEKVLLSSFSQANKETVKLYYCDLFYV